MMLLRKYSHTRAACVALFIMLLCYPNLFAAQDDKSGEAGAIEPVYGSLSEIKDLRRVLLLTNRNFLVDSRGSVHTALASVYRPQTKPSIHAHAHNIIARRLNKYITSYRSMTAVRQVKDADFVVVFNVLRESPSFIRGRPFVFGEMFVIRNATAADPRPRIVWRTEKELTRVEDAVGKFLKELKLIRQEK